MPDGNRITHILDEIVAAKRLELESSIDGIPLACLEKRIEDQTPPLNLSGALMGDSVRVIGEVKKASPSKGILRHDFDPGYLAASYVDNGAAAVSVLTNVDHFAGSLCDMEVVRDILYPRGIPILRKDFIFDPYQIYESRASGADAVLLIVSILTPERLKELLEISRGLWMQCLVEVHDEAEIQVALDAGAEIVGINNRDLTNFIVDLEVTERLAPLIPYGKVIVSESGVSSREHVRRVGRAGANAVLVGEALMTAVNPGDKLEGLL